MVETVGIGQLAEDTGENVRTLQHWCDLGILEPEAASHKQGRGVHRTLRASPPLYGERALALIASNLNKLRVPLATIKDIVRMFRSGVVGPEAIASAMSGQRSVVMLSFQRGPIVLNHVKVEDTPDDLDEYEGVKTEILARVLDEPLSVMMNLTSVLKPLRV